MTALDVRIAFPAMGTTAVVIVAAPDDDAEAAVTAVKDRIAAVDAACSRFRDDSGLAQLNAAGGAVVAASPVLLDALEVAVRAARLSDGLVDPTVGTAMRVLGYDRDFAGVPASGPPVRMTVGPAPGWQAISIDRRAGTARVPSGVTVDLGATAKAWCADVAAVAATHAARAGVLVSIGGDVAVAGPAPAGGWRVRVTGHHSDGEDAPGQTVAITTGGLATSGTTARRWRRGGRELHHVVDPATGWSASGPWHTVSVAAGSCVDANTAATAAIVLGDAAPAWLETRGLAARLVRADGGVVRTAGWPSEEG